MVECNLAKVKVKGSNPFNCFLCKKNCWIDGRAV